MFFSAFVMGRGLSYHWWSIVLVIYLHSLRNVGPQILQNVLSFLKSPNCWHVARIWLWCIHFPPLKFFSCTLMWLEEALPISKTYFTDSTILRAESLVILLLVGGAWVKILSSALGLQAVVWVRVLFRILMPMRLQRSTIGWLDALECSVHTLVQG